MGLQKLDLKLKREWADVLLQEEVLWMQKSWVDWLRMGNKNTKFLHTSTLVRRRRNRVELLMNEESDWLAGSAQLKNMAFEFYTGLFSTDPLAGVNSLLVVFLRLKLAC